MAEPRVDPPALSTAALEYELPERLIATRPAEPRDAARLLVVRRGDGSMEHGRITDLPGYLETGDLLVVNDTRVHPARLVGARADTAGRVGGLFVDEVERGVWRVLLQSNGRLRPGVVVDLHDASGAVVGRLTLHERDGAGWRVQVEPDETAESMLARAGRTPLPPYIVRARDRSGQRVADTDDRRWYQTVYASDERAGSVAAPTAGLHFTPAVLDDLASRGVERRELTLHVGEGTFRPVAAATLAEHPMHAEWFEVPAETTAAIRSRRAGPGRIIAVGTTSVRALESLPDLEGDAHAGHTDLLIAPPYAFRHVDGMVTNFHLPRSTLLALVAAMIGIDRMHEVYAEAIRREYRFYSYGDAMLILP